MKVHLVAGCRPNFVKIAPLYEVLAKAGHEAQFIHMGQHGSGMDNYSELGLPIPHARLYAMAEFKYPMERLGAMMRGYEIQVRAERPDIIVVPGDTDSSLAAAMVAARHGIKLAHLEAGLRSWTNEPEEYNRRMIDELADLRWAPDESAMMNLIRPSRRKVSDEIVGNIMIDTAVKFHKQIEARQTARQWGFHGRDYVLVTMHRPFNVDTDRFTTIMGALYDARLPVVFPGHPRVAFAAAQPGHMLITSPLGYVDFQSLLCHARLVVTDSGGVQEEATYWNVPCLTARNETERPLTVECGTNTLVKPEKLEAAMREVWARGGKIGHRPKYWDGRTAERCVVQLEKAFY